MCRTLLRDLITHKTEVAFCFCQFECGGVFGCCYLEDGEVEDHHTHRFPHPLHGVLVISQVVEAQGHPCCCYRGPWDFQKLLHATVSHKFSSEFLVQQQGGQVLRTDTPALECGRRPGGCSSPPTQQAYQGHSERAGGL